MIIFLFCSTELNLKGFVTTHVEVAHGVLQDDKVGKQEWWRRRCVSNAPLMKCSKQCEDQQMFTAFVLG